MGTPLQEVYLMCQSNLFGMNLSGKETLLFNAFRKAITRCKRYAHVSLDYELNKKEYMCKLFQLSNNDITIILTINGATFSVPTFTTESKLEILEKIKDAIITVAELSRITENEELIIQSENDLEINLNYCGNSIVIIEHSYDGVFNEVLEDDEIEFIAVAMTKEFYDMEHSIPSLSKINIGTKHFDKLPDKQKQYRAMVERSKFWEDKFDTLKHEFATFGYRNNRREGGF